MILALIAEEVLGLPPCIVQVLRFAPFVADVSVGRSSACRGVGFSFSRSPFVVVLLCRRRIRSRPSVVFLAMTKSASTALGFVLCVHRRSILTDFKRPMAILGVGSQQFIVD